MSEIACTSVATETFAETMTGGRIFTVTLDGGTYVVNVFSAESQDDRGPLFSYMPAGVS